MSTCEFLYQVDSGQVRKVLPINKVDGQYSVAKTALLAAFSLSEEDGVSLMSICSQSIEVDSEYFDVSPGRTYKVLGTPQTPRCGVVDLTSDVVDLSKSPSMDKGKGVATFASSESDSMSPAGEMGVAMKTPLSCLKKHEIQPNCRIPEGDESLKNLPNFPQFYVPIGSPANLPQID